MLGATVRVSVWPPSMHDMTPRFTRMCPEVLSLPCQGPSQMRDGHRLEAWLLVGPLWIPPS